MGSLREQLEMTPAGPPSCKKRKRPRLNESRDVRRTALPQELLKKNLAKELLCGEWHEWATRGAAGSLFFDSLWKSGPNRAVPFLGFVRENALGGERGKKFQDVIGSPSFHRDSNGRVAQVYAAMGSIVRRLDDIGAVLSKDPSKPV